MTICSQGIQHNLVCIFRNYNLFSMIFRSPRHFWEFYLNRRKNKNKSRRWAGIRSAAFGLMGQRPMLLMGPRGQAGWPGSASKSVGQPTTPVHGARARHLVIVATSGMVLWMMMAHQTSRRSVVHWGGLVGSGPLVGTVGMAGLTQAARHR
jgi:hypothetical protein